jgi:murein DD-endopeptidase MepM/ murein hydrolase activator NlpD
MNPISGGAIPSGGKLSFGYNRGLRNDGSTHWHNGIDIPAIKGTPVHAAAAGTVTHTVRSYDKRFAGYGKTIVILGNNGFYYLYGHLDEILVNAGQKINTGQLIGKVGYTAFSTANPTGDLESRGAHLHFEVSTTGYPQSSLAYRTDPVSHLAWLEGAAGIGGILFIAFAGAGYWYLAKKSKRRKQRLLSI